MMSLTGMTVIFMYVAAAAMFLVAMMFKQKQRDASYIPALPFGKVPVWFFHKKDVWFFWGIAMFYFFLVMAGEFVADDKEMKLTAGGLVTVIWMQVMMAVIAVVIVIRRVGLVEWLGLRWKQWPWILLIGPGVVVGMWMIFGVLLAMGYGEWLERIGGGDPQETVEVLKSEKDTVVLLLMVFTAVVVAPICEEIVFRGYLYGAAKKFVGPWVAGVATGLVFSAVHGNMSAMLQLFLFGMALAWLYEFTGSIWAPMAVHFLFNGATVILQILLRYGVLEVPVK